MPPRHSQIWKGGSHCLILMDHFEITGHQCPSTYLLPRGKTEMKVSSSLREKCCTMDLNINSRANIVYNVMIALPSSCNNDPELLKLSSILPPWILISLKGKLCSLNKNRRHQGVRAGREWVQQQHHWSTGFSPFREQWFSPLCHLYTHTEWFSGLHVLFWC